MRHELSHIFIGASIDDNAKCPIIVSYMIDGVIKTDIMNHPDKPMCFEFGTIVCSSEQQLSIPTIKTWKEKYLFLHEDDRRTLSGDPTWAFYAAIYSRIYGLKKLPPAMIDFVHTLQLIPSRIGMTEKMALVCMGMINDWLAHANYDVTNDANYDVNAKKAIQTLASRSFTELSYVLNDFKTTM